MTGSRKIRSLLHRLVFLTPTIEQNWAPFLQQKGKSLTLQAGLEQAHWGVLQYVQNNEESAITLTPTDEVTDKKIDERAEVGNLTRNIVIRGVEDLLWKDNGFGAHVMVMYPGIARVSGVEFYRVGQAGELARYPIPLASLELRPGWRRAWRP